MPKKEELEEDLLHKTCKSSLYKYKNISLPNTGSIGGLQK